jgi:hypothetical protein
MFQPAFDAMQERADCVRWRTEAISSETYKSGVVESTSATAQPDWKFKHMPRLCAFHSKQKGFRIMKNPIKRLTSHVLIISILTLGTPLPYANAAMIGTAQVATENTQTDRERVLAFLERDEMQQQFQSLGVDAQTAKERVAALSDAEIVRIAGKLDMAPAGAGVVGALVTVFVVLLITDIVGLTKVFPFTRSLR